MKMESIIINVDELKSPCILRMAELSMIKKKVISKNGARIASYATNENHYVSLGVGA